MAGTAATHTGIMGFFYAAAAATSGWTWGSVFETAVTLFGGAQKATSLFDSWAGQPKTTHFQFVRVTTKTERVDCPFTSYRYNSGKDLLRAARKACKKDGSAMFDRDPSDKAVLWLHVYKKGGVPAKFSEAYFCGLKIHAICATTNGADPIVIELVYKEETKSRSSVIVVLLMILIFCADILWCWSRADKNQ